MLNYYREIINNQMNDALKNLLNRGDSNIDFDIRGPLYQTALKLSPNARQDEIDTLETWINAQPNEVSLDLAAGSGFLTLPLSTWTNAKTFALDPSIKQIEGLKSKSLKNINPICVNFDSCTNLTKLVSEQVDIVTSLGGLHHINDHVNLIQQIYRILKPGGRFVAADVEAGSSLSRHFDDFVTSKCITSHSANWLSKQSLEKLISYYPELSLVRCETKIINWVFDSEEEMGLFFKALHAYNLDISEVLRDLQQALGYQTKDGKIYLNWPLMYFEIRKGII